MRPLVLFLATTLATTALAAAQFPAQQPTVVHAQLTTEPAPDGPRSALDRLERSGQTVWLAYSVLTNARISIGSRTPDIAYLENDASHGSYGSSRDVNAPAEDHALLLFRIADHHLTRLRVESPSRTLDAAGLPILFLTGVPPERSLGTLQLIALAPDPAARQLRDAAVFLISLHRSPSTVSILTTFAAPSHDPDLREKAAFWLGTSTDPAAFTTLQHLARTDPDPSFRAKLTFDLTLSKAPSSDPGSDASPQPQALAELIRMAHTDPAPEVRKQAQFWMGTLGGQRVTADLRASAESDPDQDVRRSAVFALSRLPTDQATPQLIHLAQTSHDPDTRKQAVFWLGQSTDPKALDYLTGLLSR